MRRIIMGILVLAAVACDSEGVNGELEPGLDGAMEVDGLVDQDGAIAQALPTVNLNMTSFTDNTGTIVAELICDDASQGEGVNCDVFCGVGVSECIVCEMTSMESGDHLCDLAPGPDFDVTIYFDSGPIYAYIDTDGNKRWIQEISAPWTLGGCGSTADSCDCEGQAGCGCAVGMLDFSVTLPDGYGPDAVVAAEPDPKVQLSTGDCGN